MSVLLLCIGLLLSCKWPFEPVDTQSPTIIITTPTIEWAYSTTDSILNIAGIAYDDNEVVGITWETNSGSSGEAMGTTNWSATGIKLEVGDNTIVVMARDAADNVATDTIIVTYNKYVYFIGLPSYNPSNIFINRATNVVITVAIAPNPNLDPHSVKLVQLDATNNIIDTLGWLTDDGDLGNCDDIAGDGVYSTKHTFMESYPCTIRLRILANTVEVEGTVTSFSPIFTIMAIKPIAYGEVATAINTQQLAEQKYETYLETNSADGAKQLTVEWLKQQTGVKDAGLSEDHYNIWIDYESGLAGVILIHTNGIRGGGPPATQRINQLTIPLSRQNRGILIKTGLSDDEGDIVESKNVLVYDVFNWQFNTDDEGPSIHDMFSNSKCPKFTVTYLKDTLCTVDEVRNFTQYGTIAIITHGGCYKERSLFLTGEVADSANFMHHLIDLLSGRIAIATLEGKPYYAILPSFISNLSETFPKSIIYNGACGSSFPFMSNAFIGRGAATYFGFTKSVHSNFAKYVAEELFDKLINEGKATGEAFEPCQTDPTSPKAKFVMFGDNGIYLDGNLVNGGFEKGNLAGWNTSGDGRIITQLGPLRPQEGNFMGIISTGLGYSKASGSISQSFCIPTGKTILSFKYNFISEEFMEWCGSIYQDYFKATLITPTEDLTIVFYHIDDLCDTVTHVGIAFDKGDVYMTGWRQASIDVSAYAGTGEGVTLTLSCGDIGDSNWDTAILIDDIKLEEAPHTASF